MVEKQVKNGKFVYKNIESMRKMHDFYDRTLASLNVPYIENNIKTSFGRTHSHLPSEKTMTKICAKTKEFFLND